MSTLKPRQLVVVSLPAEDVPTTVHFYRDIIGLRLLPQHGQQPAFDLGNGLHLVIVQGKSAPSTDSGTPRFPQLAFAVDDLDVAVAQLQARQISLPWGIETKADNRWIMFHDPAGNLIEFAQFGP